MRKIILCLLALLVMASTALAAERKEEWRDKSTDFKQIKTIVIKTKLDKQIVPEDIDQQKLNELLAPDSWREALPNLRWLNEEQLAVQLAALPAPEGDAATDDSAQMRQRLAQVVDAELSIEVRQWGYSKEWVPDSWESYTEYRSTPITVTDYDEKGNARSRVQWVQVPVEKTRLVPAHYTQFAHAGLVFTLTNAKTGAKSWMLLDLRDASGTKVPLEMTERIVKRAIDRFATLVK